MEQIAIAGGKLTGISTNGVFGVELVGYVAVVLSRMSFPDCGLHEAGKRGKNIDWGIYASVV